MEEQKYYLKIKLITEGTPYIDVSLVEEPQQNDEYDNLDFFHEHVASTIDITSFYIKEGIENDYSLVVDDEGLLVSNNPVFKLVYKGEYERELCGTILVGKNKLDGMNIDTIGMTKKEIEDFIKNIKISVIGFTR